MAELNDFVESLEKELNCPICQQIFQDPTTLPCLHSLCRECITRLKEASGDRQLRCPTCRGEIDGDISRLRSSFQLKSMIEFLHKTRSKASEQDDQLPNCASCKKKLILVAFCPKCEGMICTKCVIGHNEMKVLQDHQLVMFCDFKQEHLNSYIMDQVHCEVQYHENEKLQYFCQTCQQCICLQCSNTAHDTCKKINIEEKAEEVKRLIKENLVRVNQLKEKFLEELELSKQNIVRLESAVSTAKKEVSDNVQDQVKILKDHENTMKNTLDKILLEQKEANDEEQSEINTVIQQLEAVHDQGETLCTENVDHFILQSQLPQRCDELLQRPSVTKSKPNERDTSVSYIPNAKVTCFLQDLQNLDKIVQSVPDPSQCSIEFENDQIRFDNFNKFEIVTRNAEGQVCYTDKGSIDVKIIDVIDEYRFQVENKLTEVETGKFIVDFRGLKLSCSQILVNIGGKSIKNSPMINKNQELLAMELGRLWNEMGSRW